MFEQCFFTVDLHKNSVTEIIFSISNFTKSTESSMIKLRIENNIAIILVKVKFITTVKLV